MFYLMAHLFHNYASFTNEVFGQLLSNYSRYGANLNMKAVNQVIDPFQFGCVKR